MMKKALVVLLLAAFLVPAFADDAIVLPQGVMRTRVIPSVTIANSFFDNDGKRQDETVTGIGTVNSTTLYNLSFALEYGVTDWLTAGLQWVPAWRFASSFDFDFNDGLSAAPPGGLGMDSNEKIASTGIADLFVGAKIQAVGPRGLVPNQNIRLAVTPGVKIPLTQYDAEKESENFVQGREFQTGRVDNGAWGLGGRLALDLIVSPQLYINLYNQTIFYLPVDQTNFNPEAAALPGFFDYEEVEVKYGTDLTFEIEAAYTMPLGGGVNLGLGLPVTYDWTGATEEDGDKGEESWTVGVGPNISFFFTQWALPMEFELGYQVALAGKNAPATNTISLQIKNFLRF